MTRKLLSLVALGLVGIVAIASIWSDRETSTEQNVHLRDRGHRENRTTQVVPAPVAAASAAQTYEAADDPAGGLLLEGLVVDADDIPVAGAWVSLNSRPPRRVQSGEDGTFSFTNLVEGTYAVAAFHDQAAAGPVTTVLTKTSDPIILHTRSANKAVVVVVQAGTSRPIEDAKVVIRGGIAMTTNTNDRGVALFGALTDGAHVIQVEAGGYAPARATIQVTGGGGTLVREVIALEKGAPLGGGVVAEDGSLVYGARVSLFAEGDATPLAVGLSDEAGAWRFSAAPAGRHYVAVDDERYVRSRSDVLTLDGRNGREDVVITLSSGSRISGRVVTPEGQGVPYARVRLRHVEENNLRRQVTCDANGRFEISGLPPGSIELLAHSTNSSSATQTVELPTESNERTGIEIPLALDAAIAGIVRGVDGEVVAQAQVTAVLRRPSTSTPHDTELRGALVALSNSGGQFELRGLVPGSYELRASIPGGPPPSDFQFANTGDLEVALVLSQGGRVRGRVVYRNGSPVQVFQVSLGGMPPRAFAASDGRFEIDECPPGEQRLTIKGPTFPTAHKRVSVIAGKDQDAGAIEVGGGRRVAGRVVDSGGAPVAGALVSVGAYLVSDGSSPWQKRAKGAGRRNVTTSGDGRFEFIGLGGEELAIIAEHPDFGRSTDAKLPRGIDDLSIDLALRKAGVIEGRVSLAGEARHAIVTASTTNSRSLHQTMALDDGRFRFTRLAPGSYVVAAHFSLEPGHTLTSRSAPVTVVSSDAQSVNINVPQEDASVQIRMKTSGEREWLGQLYLAPGEFQVDRAVDLESVLANIADGAVHLGAGRSGQTVGFSHVSEGPHTACVIPIPVDLDHVGDMVRDDPGALRAHCQPVDVESGANEVVLTVDPAPRAESTSAPPRP